MAEKTLTLARLAVGVSNGDVSKDDIAAVKALIDGSIADGMPDEDILAEVAAIPVGWLWEHIKVEGAHENFRTMYCTLGLEAYCPTETMEYLLDFLSYRKGEGGVALEEHMHKAYEGIQAVQREKLRANMLYCMLSFLVGSGTHMRYSRLLSDILKDFESISPDVRQAADLCRPAFLQGL